jgi:hypothetical protein
MSTESDMLWALIDVLHQLTTDAHLDTIPSAGQYATLIDRVRLVVEAETGRDTRAPAAGLVVRK